MKSLHPTKRPAASWWFDLPIAWKLFALPGATLLVLLLVIAATSRVNAKNHKLLERVQSGQVPALEIMLLFRYDLESLQRNFQDAITSHDEDYLQVAAGIEQRIRGYLGEALGNPSLDLSSVKALRGNFELYYGPSRDVAVRAIRNPDDIDLSSSIRLVQGRYFALRQQVEQLADEARNSARRFAGSFKTMEDNWTKHFWFMVFALLGTLAILFPLTRNLTRSITTPLLEIVEASQRFAKGDLSVKIVARSEDETGRLAKAFGEMIGRIATLVEQIGDSSGHLASSATQISASTDGLAQGGDRQAQGTADAARSAEMFAESAREVSGRVDRAHEISTRARETASQSAAVLQEATDRLLVIAKAVEKAVGETERLASHAASIGKVAGVIREIAGKTKLLSLNAAIEAARAGEHGRGFEVVANEVGTLATSSTASIGEVEGQLGGIQQAVAEVQEAMEQVREAVQSSAHLGEQAGAALQSLVSGAEETKGVLADLAGAAGEQAATAESLSKQMETIASATHENAMNTEEIAGTARELARLAGELQRATAFFRFEKIEEPESARSAPAILPSLEKEIPAPSGESLVEAA